MGWFKKKKEPLPPKIDRYEGRPLLILLENYVLSCIGCLPEEKVPALTGVVQKVYGGGDDWKATLRSTLNLEDALDDELEADVASQPRHRKTSQRITSARGFRPHGRGR